MRFELTYDNDILAINEETGEKVILKRPLPGKSLAEKYPQLLGEWNPTKNLPLTPDRITAGNGVKVWWKCSRGHEWQARALSRVRQNAGCPYCVAASTSYGEQFVYWSFKQLFPDLNSSKHVLNRNKVSGFEFDIIINPLNLYIEYSSDHWHKEERHKIRDELRRKYCKENNINYIEIIEKSRRFELSLTPNYIQYYRGDGKEALKKIVKYIANQFNISTSNIDYIEVDKQATEYSKGKINYEESLEFLYPDVAEEWDTEKNGDIKASEIKATSNRRVYWKCKKHGHSWEATISNRARNNTGCPYCSNNRLLVGYNDFATVHPELLEEWDYEKNGELKPTDIIAGYLTKVWWKCKKCKHSWQISPAQRHFKSVGCPVCAGKYQECLAVTHPEVAALWHPTMNGDLTPNDITAGSHIEVYWKMPHGKVIKRKICYVTYEYTHPKPKTIKGYEAVDFW